MKSPLHLLILAFIPLAIFSFLSAVPASASGAEGPAAPAAAPRFDDWIVIGPGGGGAQYLATISPHDPKKVFVRCDMTGAYITNDGGESWRMFNLRRPPGFFVWDPVDPNVAYASSNGLYRTADGGRTWELVHPDPDDVERIVEVGDHASPRFILKKGREERLSALAVDPADSKKLYAVIDGAASNFCVSSDWGKTWKVMEPLPAGGGRGGRGVYVDPRSPADNRTIYVVGSQVSVLENGEWRHQPAPQGMPAFSRTALGFPEQGRPIVYGISSAGVSVSLDGGATWDYANQSIADWVGGLSGRPQFRAVACSINHPETAYLSIRGLQMVSSPGEETFGIAKTTNAGRTWELVIEETSDVPSPRVKGAWLNEWFGPDWGENPIDIGIAPSDPDIVFTTDLGRTMKTEDGMKTLRAAYSKKLDDGTYTTRGLDVTTNYGVHWDPFDENRMFISYTDIGPFMSTDGGGTWRACEVPRDWRNTTYWMVFDPEVKGRAWAVMCSSHDLPRPKMFRDRGALNYNGGVCISNDGGATWTKSVQGMQRTAATHIILDPKSPKEARVLYVAGFGTGVWKSTDGGVSWTKKNKGIRGTEPFAWRFAVDKNGVIYLVVARRSEDGTIGTAQDGALYRSTDGAETWSPVALPKGCNGPNGLAVDPEDPNRMYLAAWGRSNDNGDTDGGIYLTTDGGKTWRNVESTCQHAYDVTIDPKDPNILYSCGFESSVLRSEDRGETWKRIKGFNFKWGHRVIVDPKDSGKIFVTTFGGSVWYGPAKGDPDAKEDIVTPAAAYSR